jgi:hypothetical protein
MRVLGHIRGRSAKALRLACALLVGLLLAGFAPPTIRVDAGAVGPRALEDQTKTAVVRDYLQAWKSMSQALQENRVDVLDTSYLGLAKEKLAEAVREQRELGIKTNYRDLSHNLKIVFYSPEGMSVQLVDTVEYDMQIVDQDQVLAPPQHVRARYVAVLTPTEVRWKVRVFQAQPE